MGPGDLRYDLRTIPLLLKEWSEQGVAHGGVILVDERTIAPHDVGGLIRALHHVVQTLGDVSWADRVVFLQRA